MYGTMDDPSKIVSMAGSEELNPSMSTADLVALIRQAKKEPVERDTLYNELQNFGKSAERIQPELN